MGFGGVLAQYAAGNGDLDRALRSLVGQVLGFVAVVAFGYWLMRRSRAKRGSRPPVSGWYDDPWGGPYQRWWNGDEWTANVREHPWAGHPPGAYGPHVPGAPPPSGPPHPGDAGPGWGSPPSDPGGPGGPFPPG